MELQNIQDGVYDNFYEVLDRLKNRCLRTFLYHQKLFLLRAQTCYSFVWSSNFFKRLSEEFCSFASGT